MERVKALTVGDPINPTTIVGPSINKRGAQRVSALIKDAAAKGANLLTGDGAVEGQNAKLVKPVVLTDVATDLDITPPRSSARRWSSTQPTPTVAAIDLANDTEYGLAGGVISRDVNAALEVAPHVRSGVIHINDQGIGDEPMRPSAA